MPVPNSLTRVINKHGQIVAFDISKIHFAISKAIENIEHANKWEAEKRALKYAEMIRDRIYMKFYDLDWLLKDFTHTLNGFESNELEDRITKSNFASRLTILLYQHFLKDRQISKIQSEAQDSLFEFCEQTIAPYLNSKLKVWQSAILNSFINKINQKNQQGLKDTDYYPDREFLQDMIEEKLKEIGEIYIAEGFMVFREGKRKIQSGEITPPQFTHDGIHRDMLRKTLLWNIENECDSVFSLNDWIIGKGNKDFKQLVKISDKRFYDDLTKIVDGIIKKKDQLKVVIIAGPSCSNKTTITTIIGEQLSKQGIKLKQLNIDDYFFDLKNQPKDAFGDYDYEMPQAIDMALLNQHLSQLVKGETISKPTYDFKKGCRSSWSDFRVEADELILIDCLHGLYRKLTKAVSSFQKFKIYTESMNVLRNTDGSYTKWTDARLCKRMIRDVKYRNYDTSKTLAHWAYVRKGELKHIIPYIYSCDAVINSGLPYELPILKTALNGQFPSLEYIEKLRIQGRLDAYIRGMRISTLFDTILPCSNLNIVPGTSPIREFIGGSDYDIAHNE